MLYRLKQLVTIRFILTVCLLLSMAYAGYSMYYKINYWGFSLAPKTRANVWTVEADVAFETISEQAFDKLLEANKELQAGALAVLYDKIVKHS